MLEDMNTFAEDHRLRWGQVMRVGNHRKEDVNEWKIVDMKIDETKSYKYLGDVITDDGKNTRNIDSRKHKSTATTINIKMMASNESFKQIGASVLIELHETINMSAVLTNCESWNLIKKRQGRVGKKSKYKPLNICLTFPYIYQILRSFTPLGYYIQRYT